MGDDVFRLIAYDLPNMAKNKQTNLLLMLQTWMSAIGVFATQEYKPQIKKWWQNPHNVSENIELELSPPVIIEYEQTQTSFVPSNIFSREAHWLVGASCK